MSSDTTAAAAAPSETAPPAAGPWQPPSAPTPTNHLAVWSWVVALPLPLLGLVLGIVGVGRARRRHGAGMSHGVVGIVLSSTVLALALVVTAVGALAGLAGTIAAAAPVAEAVPEAPVVPAVPDGDAPWTDVAALEQLYLGSLEEETYWSDSDAALVGMGWEVCDRLAVGDDAEDVWMDLDAGADASTDIMITAVLVLCPEQDGAGSAWAV